MNFPFFFNLRIIINLRFLLCLSLFLRLNKFYFNVSHSSYFLIDAHPAAKAYSMLAIHPGVRKSVLLAILMFVSLLNITKLFRDDMFSLMY